MDKQALNHVLERLAAAARDAGRPQPRLLAVSKTQPATAVAEMADALRAASASGAFPDSAAFAPAFGENYVQEALAKQAALAGQTLEWHLIGHLQSNKAREAALAFDWVQTVDRDKLVAALARHRAPDLRLGRKHPHAGAFDRLGPRLEGLDAEVARQRRARGLDRFGHADRIAPHATRNQPADQAAGHVAAADEGDSRRAGKGRDPGLGIRGGGHRRSDTVRAGLRW
jgi:hypothetical protein